MKLILLIDDDRDFVESAVALLKSHDYETTEAYSGKEGFEIAVEKKPDLILLDVMMARKTEGYDLARKLNKNRVTKNIPVIMITGIRETTGLPFELKPDEDRLPVKAILEKPVVPEELIKSVTENI